MDKRGLCQSTDQSISNGCSQNAGEVRECPLFTDRTSATVSSGSWRPDAHTENPSSIRHPVAPGESLFQSIRKTIDYGIGVAGVRWRYFSRRRGGQGSRAAAFYWPVASAFLWRVDTVAESLPRRFGVPACGLSRQKAPVPIYIQPSSRECTISAGWTGRTSSIDLSKPMTMRTAWTP